MIDNCEEYTDIGNNNPNYLQGSPSSLGFIDLIPWTYNWNGVRSGYEYNCDDVCLKRGGKICIGVGLTNAMDNATACKYDACDSGPTCTTAGNLENTTCKENFYYWSTHSCWDGSHVFPVKSTACYCL